MTNLSHKKLAFYGLVLVAALVGLIIDRTDSASAAPASRPMGAPFVADGDEVSDMDPNIIGPALAAVFKEGTAAGDETDSAQAEIIPIRDAFSLSDEMRAHYESSVREAVQKQKTLAEEQKRIDREDAATFEEAHILKGTFVHPPDVWAVVDDLILRAGDELDGFILRKIDHYRVVFEKGDNQITLELPDTPGSQGSEWKSR